MEPNPDIRWWETGLIVLYLREQQALSLPWLRLLYRVRSVRPGTVRWWGPAPPRCHSCQTWPCSDHLWSTKELPGRPGHPLNRLHDSGSPLSTPDRKDSDWLIYLIIGMFFTGMAAMSGRCLCLVYWSLEQWISNYGVPAGSKDEGGKNAEGCMRCPTGP